MPLYIRLLQSTSKSVPHVFLSESRTVYLPKQSVICLCFKYKPLFTVNEPSAVTYSLVSWFETHLFPIFFQNPFQTLLLPLF